MVGLRMQTRHPEVTWWCPQLPPSPQEAYALIEQGTAGWPSETMAVVGSSLGGFYATRLAATRNCRLVVLNPAVHPARDLARHIGQQSTWQNPQEQWFFRPEHIDEFRTLETTALPDPGQCLAIIAKGDELLDWREMAARYPSAQTVVLPGSDHALSDFDQHIDRVFAHLGLN